MARGAQVQAAIVVGCGRFAPKSECRRGQEMAGFRYISNSEEDTRRFGTALAHAVPGGTTVALIGTLGSGKTRIAQAVAEALGIPPQMVNSPTFVLCQEYEGTRSLYHMDAYRLRDEDEFMQLGPDEYFESAGITLVEWADRVEACLPDAYLRVIIEPTGNNQREIELSAVGEGLDAIVGAIKTRLTAVKPASP